MTLDAYADLDTFRQYLRASAVLSEGDDPDSALEALALESASRAIDNACGRSFTVASATGTARYYTVNATEFTNPGWGTPFIYETYRYTLPMDDVFDVTGMTVFGDSTGNGDYTNEITDYIVGPRNAPGKGLPYTLLRFDTHVAPSRWDDGIEVTAKWGWPEVPDTIVNATLLQAARFLKRRDAAFGVAGSPEMGNMIRLLNRLDPDVSIMVAAYRKKWGAA